MGEVVTLIGSITTLSLLLISLGVLYGQMKTKQDAHTDSLDTIKKEFADLKAEIRDEFKDFRKEFENFRKHCKGICQYNGEHGTGD